jgi:release factor glutamine methyltransferase
MKVRAVVQAGASRLRAAGIEAARSEAWLLLASAADRPRAALMVAAEEEVAPAIRSRLEGLIGRRAAREPIAYILGEKEFWSLRFEVSPAVLIPRPDSETLVEAALDHLLEQDAAAVLDLGTGSGCLLLSVLSERPHVFGVGVDRSEAAVLLARRNARGLGLDGRSGFLVGDWGSALTGAFDLILCNPPYIAAAEMARLARDVAGYEPRTALVAGTDGCAAYARLVPALPHLLRPGGLLCLEVGQGQAARAGALLAAAGLVVREVRRDLAGIERCLIAAAK